MSDQTEYGLAFLRSNENYNKSSALMYYISYSTSRGVSTIIQNRLSCTGGSLRLILSYLDMYLLKKMIPLLELPIKMTILLIVSAGI